MFCLLIDAYFVLTRCTELLLSKQKSHILYLLNGAERKEGGVILEKRELS